MSRDVSSKKEDKLDLSEISNSDICEKLDSQIPYSEMAKIVKAKEELDELNDILLRYNLKIVSTIAQTLEDFLEANKLKDFEFNFGIEKSKADFSAATAKCLMKIDKNKAKIEQHLKK